MIPLENHSLFNYLPHNCPIKDFSGATEDEIYGTAHNIVIAATEFAVICTNQDFESFDEEREEAIEYIIDKMKKV